MDEPISTHAFVMPVIKDLSLPRRKNSVETWQRAKRLYMRGGTESN